jgi:hypothetical protein
LIGANTTNNWNITGNNSGTVNDALNFLAFGNLTGSSLEDTFVFDNGQGVSGIIDGAGGSNTLNYSTYTTPVTVNLATNTATGVGANISSIQNVIGGSGTNTLIGSNSSNTWNITSANAGNLNGATSFTAISNFTGGNLDDTFQFSPNASISGNLNGQAGNLTLIGDELNFVGEVSGTGDLTLQPFTPTQAIQIGGSDSGNSNILDLTGTKLSLLENGFSSIAIGRADGSGTITLAGDVTFNDPVTLRSTNGSGSINHTSGSLTGADDASITLLAEGNIRTGDITANPGITITSSSGSIDTSTLTTDGEAIALSAAGNITTSNIASHSDAAAGGDITLEQQHRSRE